MAVVGVTFFPNMNVGISALMMAGFKQGPVVFIMIRNIGIYFWFTKRLIKSILDVEYYQIWLPRLLSGKEPACNAGGMGLIPGSGRSPWRRKCHPLQYSHLNQAKIRTEEPGRLQSMESQRAKQDGATEHALGTNNDLKLIDHMQLQVHKDGVPGLISSA